MTKPVWDGKYTPMYSLEHGVPGVRLATKADEQQIYLLLLMMHAECGIFSFNRAKVIEGIQIGTERRGGLIFVIEENNVVVATLGMIIASDWYSDDEFLLERWNFVHPQYRRSDYARRLLEQAKWASDRYRAGGKFWPFQCGITSIGRTEAKIRLYARHMPCIGAFFLYGMPPLRQEAIEEMQQEVHDANLQRRQEHSQK